MAPSDCRRTMLVVAILDLIVAVAVLIVSIIALSGRQPDAATESSLSATAGSTSVRPATVLPVPVTATNLPAPSPLTATSSFPPATSQFFRTLLYDIWPAGTVMLPGMKFYSYENTDTYIALNTDCSFVLIGTATQRTFLSPQTDSVAAQCFAEYTYGNYIVVRSGRTILFDTHSFCPPGGVHASLNNAGGHAVLTLQDFNSNALYRIRSVD
jgi:hypothetical protein